MRAALAPGSIVVMGPTASGKTRLAVTLARALGGEVVSVDSRQAYRGLDLLSGKDLPEYGAGDGRVPVHGLDVAGLDEEYSLFAFLRDAGKAAADIAARGRRAVYCGGTGLYLDALLSGYELREAPRDEGLRRRLAGRPDAELRERLAALNPRLHNTTDLADRERLLRALEVAGAGGGGRAGAGDPAGRGEGRRPGAAALLLVLDWESPLLRERVRRRLRERLGLGMRGELEGLLAAGVPDARLDRLGLEPRWLLRLRRGELDEAGLEEGLEREIWRFARGQRSWLRRFARAGFCLHALDGAADPLGAALDLARRHLEEDVHA